ncbi:DUF445 domain-containing protein [Bacillus marasmi]|uniref:DUF445 domain-containing protein n=1 Tax=Bacillus marasmi TaxID=1926279 RepID=UPI001FEBBF42|nr:DUF445 domain-containing protein [Bacillus marasmi]
MTTKSKESKKIARYSLLIMGAGFLGTIPFQGSFWVDLLQGGFEAGLVGGLADWFAVTALFRHPLGIPIPHTALLPKNRDRMTNGLVKTIKTEWLSKESIQDKIKQIKFTDILVGKIEKELHTDAFRHGLVSIIKKMISYIDVDRLTPVVKKQILKNALKINTSKILQTVGDHLLKEHYDQRALDHVLKKAENWLNESQTTYKLGAVSMNMLDKIEVDGILQFALNSMRNLLSEEKLGSIVKKLLLSGVNSLQKETDPNREAILTYIRNELQKASENVELLTSVENWKEQFLSNWEPDETISKTLHQFKQTVLETIEDEAFIETYLMPLVEHILTNVKEQDAQIDAWLQKQISTLVERNHEQIGKLVKENLDKLDNETLINTMENNIGKDLQWIRVNGAVCGFIIGIFLTGIQAVFRLV